ncbi:MAG: UDP-2,3-diacylglucosamine diphosphatase LpxI domain-containing protein [Syntrophobacteria bacterium]
MKKIGLIAGGGQFPILFARAARQNGVEVVAVALKGEADELLQSEVDVCAWVSLGKLGRMIETFQKAQVTEVAMAGAVAKTKLFSKIRPDWKAVRLLARMLHKKDDAILRAFTEELEAHGIQVRPSTLFLPELLAPPGILTRRRPNARERRDIIFGWNLAKEIGKLDIGQCILVRDQAVLAVEAIEGTDETIRRGGGLGKSEVVVVKVCKPHQDLRFDVPAVGLQTIETMKEVGASVLVVEADRTLMFDRAKMIQAANDARIAILSRPADRAKASELDGLMQELNQLDGEVGDSRNSLFAVQPRITVNASAPRMAVVGVGYLGQFHAEKYAALEETNLVAVADIEPSRARRMAEDFSCQACASHRELIGKVDAASVVVPTQDHCQVARDLLAAGIHVLVEKPMTATLEEADALIQLAKANNLVLQVGHLERFNPAVVAAREYVQQPLFVESHRLASFTERGTEVDVILDLMIHDIDIILSLVPFPLEDLRVGGAKILTPHTDIANVRLEFANGCIANVTASRISAKRMRKIRIFQPDSYLSLDYAEREVELFRKLPEKGADGFPEIEYQQLPVADTDPLEEQLRAFAESVRTGTKPMVSGEEGRKALEVATQVSELIQQQGGRLGIGFGLSGWRHEL